jgi:hypothetical protein
MWVRCTNLFAQGESAFRIVDFWELRAGDRVTITNRLDDLPAWFQLHPLEVRGALAYEMVARLNAGYLPGEPLDGPNLWRVRSGDRLVWVEPSGSDEPGPVIRALLSFGECALVFGESEQPAIEDPIFGSPTTQRPSPAVAAALKMGFREAVNKGTPRSFEAKWGLG